MAAIRERTGSWNVYWTRGGRAGRGTVQSLTFASEVLARAAKVHAESVPRHDISSDEVLSLTLNRDTNEIRSSADRFAASPVTVAELVPRYLSSLLNAENRTKRRYARQLQTDVVPNIGHLNVTEVTASNITSIIATLKSCDCDGATVGPICARRRNGSKRDQEASGHVGGLDRRTVDRYYTVMKALFQHAVEENIRPDNPVKKVKWKAQSLTKYNTGRREENHYYLTIPEFEILRSCFEPNDVPLVDFLADTGTRFSEGTALKVRNVDFAARKVAIVDAWKEDEQGRPLIGTPKAGSNRTVSLTSRLVAELAPLVERKSLNALVFTGRGGKQLRYDDFRSRWDQATLKAARCPEHPPVSRGGECAPEELRGRKCGENGGLTARGQLCKQWLLPGYDRCADHHGPAPDAESTCACPTRLTRRPTVHDLRHSYTALLLSAGVNLLTVSRNLGHASVLVTEQVYAGLLHGSDEHALETLNRRTSAS